MATKYIRIGSLQNIHLFDDGDFDGGLETDDTIKAHQAPVAGEDVLRLDDIGALVGNVYGDAAGVDERVVRFDADGYHLQNSLVSMDDAGAITFPGATSGLRTGCCYGDHIAWAQAAAVQNTWYNISDADMIDGTLRGVTHDGSGELTVLEPGLWMCLYTITFETDHANEHIECGFEVNNSGSAAAMGITHLETKFANSEGSLTGFATLDLADNSTVEVCIRTTDAGVPDITVDDLHLLAILIGGT